MTPATALPPRARLALLLLALLVCALLVAPLLLPYGPNQQLDLETLAQRPPSLAHPLGTDAVARDVLARTLAGARVSLTVALGAVGLALTIGAGWGLLAGLARPGVDALLMRVVDAFASIPRVLLLLAVLASIPTVPLWALIVLLGATSWFTTARLVRAEVRTLRQGEFVIAARALGQDMPQIAWQHLRPHITPIVLATGAVAVADVILLEAGLSWLGVGVQPPTASWGNIIRDGFETLQAAPWIWVAPGTCLVLVVMLVNLLADGLRNDVRDRQLPR